ncbi:MAG: DUF2793 domain-containing protein [Hyphomonadaceae bacterium]
MSRTNRLNLPLLLASQADKHVTYNEAMLALDACIQLTLVSRALSAPPAEPTEGDCYIPKTPATGAWGGLQDQLIAFQNGGWQPVPAKAGWLGWVVDEGINIRFDGSTWHAVPMVSSVNPIDQIGVNTTADITNRLAVKSEGVLFSHPNEAIGNLQVKLNKSQPNATGSLLFQTGWSGRAEIGLIGSEDLTIKVSQDGSTFKTALSIDRLSGGLKTHGGLIDSNTGLRALTLVPAVVRDIWRSDMDSLATPRTYVVASVTGDSVTITTNEVEQIFSQSLRGVSKVRIWNVSKTPARSAWVNWNSAANVFNVHQASDVAGWAAGEMLRLGDPNPTGTNMLGMIALDISDYLFNNFGVVFPQRGLKLSMAAQGVGGRVGLDCSGNGAAGTALGNSSNSDGSRQGAFADIFTNVLSPISNSNLLFVRESLVPPATALAATRLIRLVGIWV